MPSPFCGFNGIPFDFVGGGPQKVRQDRVDYYNGQVYFITQGLVTNAEIPFDQMYGLQAVVNVRPIGDGATRVYIDAWVPIASITHTLTLRNGAEIHSAILVKMTQNNRIWATSTAIRVIGADVSFLLLS